VGDVAGVVDRFLEWCVGVGIFGVANDECEAIGPGIRGDRSVDRRNHQNRDYKQCEADFHATEVQPTGRRSQLAAWRPYATQDALSNRGHDPSTTCGVGFIETIDRRGPPCDMRVEDRKADLSSTAFFHG